MDTSSSAANIFVGFGGSGIKTLMRLNSLLVQDAGWRRNLDTDVYYVVVDTEAAMLVDFQSEIKRQLHGYKEPYTDTILLSRGYAKLTPPVQEHMVRPFAGGDNEEGRKRLMEHWWTDGEGEPFDAPLVQPLSKGAGQCPLVSHFLTWMNMGIIEQRLEKLLAAIKQRRGGISRENPVSNSNVTIVAGLAGGTGRGCWQLIAYKLRQMLFQEDHNAPPTPSGFFFDKSVFPDVYGRNPSQERSMAVNALTGVSEISAWVCNQRRSKRDIYQYRLPNLRQPGEKDLNVLSPDKENDPMEGGPINSAFLIFGDNRQMAMVKATQAYETVGTALYARMTKSSIEAKRINDNFEFNSVGAGVYEIPVDGIQLYYTSKARLDTALRLKSGQTGKGLAYANEFLSSNPFHFKFCKDQPTDYVANERGDFLQQALARLQSAFTQVIKSRLDKAFEEDDLDLVVDAYQLAQEDPDTVKTVFTDQLATLPPIQKTLQNSVEKWLLDARSVGTVTEALEHLKQSWGRMVDALPKELLMEEDAGKVIERAAAREYRFVGECFNDEDEQSVRDVIIQAYLYANYKLVSTQLVQVVRSWIAELNRWITNANAFSKACDEVITTFDKELHSITGAYDYDDPAKSLFVPFEFPEKGLPQQFDALKGFNKRTIKPVDPDLKLTDKGLGIELQQLIKKTLVEDTYSLDSYAIRPLTEALEARVRESVALDSSFLENNFNMETVLKNLLRAWEKRLERSLGSDAERVGYEDRLEAFFGWKPERSGTRYKMPTPEEFIALMGASLVKTAVTCWRLRGDAALGDKEIMLFLPITELKEEYRATIESGAPTGYTVSCTADKERPKKAAGGENCYNPYAMIAYTHEGINRKTMDAPAVLSSILSLDYWKQSPEVRQWLNWCESVDGESVFSKLDSNKGLGYVDPVFVREEQLSECRWRPWKPRDDLKELEKYKTLDALLYAVLEPSGAIREQLDALGWKLPLIKDIGKERYAFTRRALMYEGEKAVEVNPCPWKPTEEICVSIWQVAEVLSGEWTKGGAKKDKGPKWRDAIIAESQEFWEKIAPALGFQSGSNAYVDLLDQAGKRLADVRDAADKNDTEIWQNLLTRNAARRTAKL